jgi:hypothetical protein
VYDQYGKRVNTREMRTRRKLEEDRHNLVQKILAINSQYKPPSDYRPMTKRYQVWLVHILCSIFTLALDVGAGQATLLVIRKEKSTETCAMASYSEQV